MNLCGDRKTASLYGSACSVQTGFMSTSTYGAAAAKSQHASAPWRCSRSEMPQVSDRIPVTLLAALNEPIFSGRSA